MPKIDYANLQSRLHASAVDVAHRVFSVTIPGHRECMERKRKNVEETERYFNAVGALYEQAPRGPYGVITPRGRKKIIRKISKQPAKRKGAPKSKKQGLKKGAPKLKKQGLKKKGTSKPKKGKIKVDEILSGLDENTKKEILRKLLN